MNSASRPAHATVRRPIVRSALVLFSLSALSIAAFMPGAFSDDKSAEHVTLVFAGDINLDGLPGKAIAKGEDPFADFADVFSAADLSIGNLECVVATKGEPIWKPWTFRAHPRVLPILAKHFSALSLANNHTGDFGHEAFLEQLALLKEHKIPCFGGGRDVVEARTPLLIERKGIRIALLGYNEYKPRKFEAGPAWPGVAWSVDEQVVADLRAARSIHKADLVIPFMHWGWENYGVNDRQKQLARLMIDNGADVVVGNHPHVTQGADYYKDKLIVYSLGNFVFDGFDDDDSNTGWLLRLTFSKKGLLEWDTVAAKLDSQGIPRRAPKVVSPYGSRKSTEIKMRAFEK